MKIVVLDGYTVNPGDNPWDELSLCGELVVYDRSVPSEVLERAHDADILVTNKTPLDRSLLEQLPRLKFIAMLATGYNVVDAEFARERNIPVANIPAYGTDTVAQFVMALVLELCHGVGQHARSVARGKWTTCQDWSYWKRPQIELRDLALGIVGFGRIGQRVAELGHAFGMNIFYSSRSPKQTTHLPVL